MFGFFKNLLIIFTAFCLLNLQLQSGFSFSNIFMPQAVMAETTQSAASAKAQADAAKASAELNAKTQASSTVSSVGNGGERASELEDEVSRVTFMEILVMLIIGFVTASLLLITAPKYTPDIVVAAVGGIIYIAGEMSAVFSHKSETADQQADFMDAGGNAISSDAQRDAVEAEIKAYENIKKTAETKAKLQKAAGGTFMAAAAMDMIVAATLELLEDSCLATIPGLSLITLTSAVCGAAAVTVADIKVSKVIPNACETDAPQRIINAKTSASCPGACTVYGTLVDYFTPICILVPTGTSLNISSEEYIADKNNLKIQKLLAIMANNLDWNFFQKNKTIKESDFYKLGYQKIIKNPFYKVKAFKLKTYDLNHYMLYRERISFLNGDTQSISLKDYIHIKNNFVNDEKMIDPQVKQSIFKLAMDKGIDFFIPRVQAGKGMGMLALVGSIGGGMVVAYFLKKQMEEIVKLYLASPFRRGIIFGVLGGLALGSAATTAGVADKAQDNIDRLNQILDNYKNYAGTKNLETDPEDDPDSDDKPDDDYSKFDNDGNVISIVPPEFDSSIENNELVADGFPCVIPNAPECGSATETFKHGMKGGKINLDPITGEYITSALAVGNEISGSKNITPSTMHNIDQLGKNAVKMSRRLKELRDKFNAYRNKKKEPTVNFKQLENQFLDSAKAALSNELAKSNMSVGDVLGSYPLGLAGDDVKKSAKGDKDKLQKKMKAIDFTIPKFKMPKFDFGMKGSIMGDDEMNKIRAAMIAKKGKHIKGDIVQNKGVSLFKIISVRYLKTGVSRLAQ